MTADRFQTRQGMQFDQLSAVDAIMTDGVKLKFLDKPLTAEQLAELIQNSAARLVGSRALSEPRMLWTAPE